MFCDAGHKCRSVEGATLSGMVCGHCNQKITVSRAAVTCVSCTFCLCHRCCEQPNCFSTAKLRAKHPVPRGCGDDCRRSHEDNGPCLVCGLGISIWHTFVCAKCTARHVSLQVGPRTTATLAEGEGVALICRVDSQITPPRDGFGEALGPVQAGRRSAQCARRSAVIPRVAKRCSCCPQECGSCSLRNLPW
jgi:hypothetical protein